MSTKIYGGFRFVPSDLNEIHTLLMTYRPTVKEAVHQAKCQFLAATAADLIDKAALDRELARYPLSVAYGDLRKRQKEVRETGRRDPKVDFEFKLAVMPYGEHVYGIAFCEQRAWQAAFFAQRWVEPWPYWDNTDQPNGMSRRDWNERGKVWDKILSGDEWDRPVGCGFSYDFEPPPRDPDAEEVLARVPSHDERVARWAGVSVMDTEFHRLIDEAGVGAGSREAMRFVFEAEENVRGEKGETLRAAERRRLASILPAITLGRLRGWSPTATAA